MEGGGCMSWIVGQYCSGGKQLVETLAFVLFVSLNLNLENIASGKTRKCASDRKSIQSSKDEKRL